jgi:ADP-heptose:LPS heptosyltransferase
MRILCIAPGGLGDQIIALPAVRFLQTIFPSHELEMRISAWASRRRLLRLCLEPAVPIRSLESLWHVRNKGSSLGRYDCIFDFDTTDGEFLTRLPTSLNPRQGFFSFATTTRFSSQVRCQRDDASGSPYWQRCFEMAFRAAAHICGTPYSTEAMLDCADRYRTVLFPPAPVRLRRRLRLLCGERPAKMRLAVTPGGYSPKHKLWPTRHFAEAIQYAAARGAAVFVLGSLEESRLAGHLFDHLRSLRKGRGGKNSGSITFLTGQLLLEELPYVLQEMDLHFSNDNGVAHIGGLTNLRQLILYRGHQSRHRSVGFRDVALFSGDDRDMTPILTRTVTARLEELIQAGRAG